MNRLNQIILEIINNFYIKSQYYQIDKIHYDNNHYAMICSK